MKHFRFLLIPVIGFAIAVVFAAIAAGFGLFTFTGTGNTRTVVVVDDKVTYALPDGRQFLVDIVGEPMTGRNVAFDIGIRNDTDKVANLFLEDTLYFEKDGSSGYELIAIDDPAVLKKGEAYGPEAEVIASKGFAVINDRKGVIKVEPGGGFQMPLAGGGPKRIEIQSPYRVVDIHHAKPVGERSP